MLKKVEKKDENLIEEYIGTDYNKCLYLYLDFMKYKTTNDNVTSWLDVENNEIKAIILKYYSGMHIFSKYQNCNYETLLNLILQEKPSIICAEKFLIENLCKLLCSKDYVANYGWVRELEEYYECDNESAKLAKSNDYDEISRLILTDSSFNNYYTFEELKNQIVEQNENNYGRNYIIKKNNKIISHAAICAENNKIAVLSHIITDDTYRHQGLATKVCSKLCNDIISEGKKVYLTNYTFESTALYDKIGFKPSCEIGKLYKK